MKAFKIIFGIVLLFGGIFSFFVNPIHFNLNNSDDLLNSAYWINDGASAIGNILSKVLFLYLGYRLISSGLRK